MERTREQLKEYYNNNLLNELKDKVNDLDLDKIYNENKQEERKVVVNEIEKSVEYTWIRIYLYEEDNKLKEGDIINMYYKPENESIDLIFGCYDKPGAIKQFYNEDLENYNPEDDRKILCLMVDMNKVNNESNDIPFIRKLFKGSRYYEPELIRIDEFEITCPDKDIEFDICNIKF